MAQDDDTSAVAQIHARLAELRRELSRTAAADARVWSMDGTTFQFDVVRDTPLPVGSHVLLRTSDGRTLLGQVTSSVPTEREGPRVAVELAGSGTALPSGSTATVRLPIRATAGSGPILGELVDGALRPADRVGFDGAAIEPAPTEAVATVLPEDGEGTLRAATHLTSPDAVVTLQATGFGRHTFVCGQSGSGKTYALGKILEQLLLRTKLRMVVLDPNSDYVTLTEPRPREETGLDEDAYREQTAQLAEVAPEVHVFGGDDVPLAVRFGRLQTAEQALVLGIDPAVDTAAYGALRAATDDAGDDAALTDVLATLDRGDDAARELARRTRNLGIDEWSIWAGREVTPVAERLAAGWRAAVLDLGAVPTAGERSVIAAAVLGALWRRRYDRTPQLIVIDDAHNVCPARPTTAAEAAAAALVRSIAAEGRKYGLYLLLSTQEPHKVHPDVLSQCANLLVMRTTSRAALEQLGSVFSDVPPGLLDLAPRFRLGEGVVAGRVVPHPLAFRTSQRLTRDGGRDVPADWATARG